MFIASDDEAAGAVVGGEVSDLGFVPIALGNIDAGGALLDRTGPDRAAGAAKPRQAGVTPGARRLRHGSSASGQSFLPT